MWCPQNIGGLPPHPLDAGDLSMDPFSSFLDHGDLDDLDDPLSAFKCAEQVEAPSSFEPAAVEQVTPPSTPRKERTADQTCPLAPGNNMPEIPILLKALKKNNLDLVASALQSDPCSAGIPFWDQDAEPPLCAAVRLGCGVDIVDLLLKFGADVNTKNAASQNPLDLLHSATWRTVVSSDEVEKLLLRAGAEASVPRQEEEITMRSGALCWDAFADAGALHDFGLPPSFGSIGLFDFEPPPPVPTAA
jgi:hypothetical protein